MLLMAFKCVNKNAARFCLTALHNQEVFFEFQNGGSSSSGGGGRTM